MRQYPWSDSSQVTETKVSHCITEISLSDHFWLECGVVSFQHLGIQLYHSGEYIKGKLEALVSIPANENPYQPSSKCSLVLGCAETEANPTYFQYKHNVSVITMIHFSGWHFTPSVTVEGNCRNPLRYY